MTETESLAIAHHAIGLWFGLALACLLIVVIIGVVTHYYKPPQKKGTR